MYNCTCVHSIQEGSTAKVNVYNIRKGGQVTDSFRATRTKITAVFTGRISAGSNSDQRKSMYIFISTHGHIVYTYMRFYFSGGIDSDESEWKYSYTYSW